MKTRLTILLSALTVGMATSLVPSVRGLTKQVPGSYRPLLIALLFALVPAAAWGDPLRFDFGGPNAPSGFIAVSADDLYNPERGYGWVGKPDLMLRDRGVPDELLRDFVFGREPAEFRVDLKPGLWRVAVHSGEVEWGNHVLELAIAGTDVVFPKVQPRAAEFAMIEAAFEVTGDHLVFRFDSPIDNWVANALVLEPAEEAKKVTVKKKKVEYDTWLDVSAWDNPALELLDGFRREAEAAEKPEPTGLVEEDYLKLIAGNVDFFRDHQDERGAIIDPYRGVEIQYSTPCYALSAAVLIEHAGRKDLIDSALLAMDWAVHSFSTRQAATGHEDFYAPVLAHALPVLERVADPARAERWREQLSSFDPWQVYRRQPGGGNWNVVALSGEAFFHLMGIREDTSYIRHSLARQGGYFRSPWGLYVEGPMSYDHFPRLWAADMLTTGYQDDYTGRLSEMLDRAAITSLFIQSPAGELPSGGRSAHHQWNEAEQAVTYEIYAAKAARDGDEFLAGVYKRAARLALGSMRRWQRASGELWIVKNRVDPAKTHAFEGYSSHSQYNLLPMAMLAIAYEHSLETRDTAERITPAEFGGFVVNLRPEYPHLFINAGGTYLQINTGADSHYNVTGLMRIHSRDFNPQIGPSDGPVEKSTYRVPEGPRKAIAVGLSWPDGNGGWDSLARYGGKSIRDVRVDVSEMSAEEIRAKVTYQGKFGKIDQVIERYHVRPGVIEISGELPGYDGPVRYTWPVLADDGERQPDIDISEDSVAVSLEGDRQVFQAREAKKVAVENTLYPYHNGWARKGYGEFEAGVIPGLTILSDGDRPRRPQ